MAGSPQSHRFVALFAALQLSLLAGCASTHPPLILVPESSQDRFVFYEHGMPIAALHRDSVLALVACEAVEMFGRPYIRVSLLYSNRSSNPILIDPLRQVTLVSTILTTQSSTRSVPDLPHQLLSEAEHHKQMELIATSFASAIRTTSTTTGQITNPGNPPSGVSTTTTTVTDERGQLMAEINIAYAAFEQSLNAGVLRKHTVFPGTGVYGYLYIPLNLPRYIPNEGQGWGYIDTWRSQAVRHVLGLQLPMLADSVSFSREAGD